jgi:alcohol dehydrogenase class IV
MKQTILHGFGACAGISEVLQSLACKKYLLVCGSSFASLGIREHFTRVSLPHARFSQFSPNPRYEDSCNGVALFRREGCDCVVAVGGGSAIDVAKCIKLFAKMECTEGFLEQPYPDSAVPLIAIPTTAGTGSESTHFAVIYRDGKKQSVAHASLFPDFAILDPDAIRTLPLYQKKCTLLDALCQAIEARWSVRACNESNADAEFAIREILQYMGAYLQGGSDEALEHILMAANHAGRAINRTTTTAAHAMSYKLTSLYGLPHGHAVAISLPKLWRRMLVLAGGDADRIRIADLTERFYVIAASMGASSPEEAIGRFEQMLEELGINAPVITADKIEELVSSVNPERLGNNPVSLSRDDLEALYRTISKE